MIKLFYVDAIAGAGKTATSIREAVSMAARGESILFVSPTVALSNESAAAFSRLCPEIKPEVIHNETAPFVGAAILKALKQRPEGGRILFITWSALESLPFFAGKERWSVFVDEVPQVAKVDELIVPDTHVHLTPHVELRPQGPAWGRVVVKRKGAVRKLAETTDTSLKTGLSALAKTLQSPNWVSYARMATYDALVNGKGKKLTLHSVLRPRIFLGFKRVTILGAHALSALSDLEHRRGRVRGGRPPEERPSLHPAQERSSRDSLLRH